MALIGMREDSTRRLQTENDLREMERAKYNRASIENEGNAARLRAEENTLMTQAGSSPEFARRLAPHRKMLGNIPTNAYIPTDREIAGGLAKEAGGADSLS